MLLNVFQLTAQYFCGAFFGYGISHLSYIFKMSTSFLKAVKKKVETQNVNNL